MPGTGARTFSQVIGYRPQPLTVPTFANSWCRPRSDTPASDQALVPLFAKNPPYRSNGEPVGIAWRGCREGVSRVLDALARRDGENLRTRVKANRPIGRYARSPSIRKAGILSARVIYE